MTLLADVVAASTEVADTSSRSRKIAVLAELLGRLEREEVAAVAGFLSGVPRQGRVGVGSAAVYGVECEPSPEPSLTVADADRAVTDIQGSTGTGSAAARRRILEDLLRRATEDEADFVRLLLVGGLRQGALAGLMVDAIAKGAHVPVDLARRAFMLSGELTRTAEIALTEGEKGL